MPKLQAFYKRGHLCDYSTRPTIKGVPAKWRPIYDELARRMYACAPDSLDFSFEAGVLVTRAWDATGPREAGWTEYRDPAAAAVALGIGDAVKVKAPAAPKAPKVAPKAAPVKAVPDRVCTVCGDPVVSGTSAEYDGGNARHLTCVAEAAPARGIDAFAPGNGSGVEFTPANGWTYGNTADVADLVRPAPAPEPTPTAGNSAMPGWADEYLGRLVYAAKRDYAAAWLAHRLTGAEAPADPGTEWADKVRARVAKLEKVAS